MCRNGCKYCYEINIEIAWERNKKALPRSGPKFSLKFRVWCRPVASPDMSPYSMISKWLKVYYPEKQIVIPLKSLSSRRKVSSALSLFISRSDREVHKADQVLSWTH